MSPQDARTRIDDVLRVPVPTGQDSTARRARGAARGDGTPATGGAPPSSPACSWRRRLAASATSSRVPTELSGATPDDVATQYVAARDRTLRTLDDEMAYLRAQCEGITGTYRAAPRLLEPLPASTDVHAPEFRYLDMASEWQSSPAFADAVRREAAPPPAPPPPGAIRRALG